MLPALIDNLGHFLHIAEVCPHTGSSGLGVAVNHNK
jgi:hypothetical protein